MKHTNLSCKIITLVVCAAMLLGLNACGSSEAKYQTEAMGTVVTGTAYGKNGDAAVKAACSVFSAMGKEAQLTICGVRLLLSIGCHCAVSHGSVVARSLIPAMIFLLLQIGHPFLFRL